MHPSRGHARVLSQSFRLPWRHIAVKFNELAGVVAQLAERLVRNEKVAGSIPVGSTILQA